MSRGAGALRRRGEGDEEKTKAVCWQLAGGSWQKAKGKAQSAKGKGVGRYAPCALRQPEMAAGSERVDLPSGRLAV